MPTSSFRDLEKVCIALGLAAEEKTKGIAYKGFVNEKYCNIMIHMHSKGRDIATGTFGRYVKDLGFNNIDEYFNYLRSL